MKNKKWGRELSLFLVMTMLLCISGFAVDADTPSEAAEAQTVDSTELTEDAAVAMLAADSNHYPIVLVHGLFGWGGREIAGLNYWGGTSSLRDILNNAGYEVYTPSIGPVASNWDRACELYAYLVGGTVDAKNDHRIAMSAAIAATVCRENVTILGAECVRKSYPQFFEEYRKLGGSYEQYLR